MAKKIQGVPLTDPLAFAAMKMALHTATYSNDPSTQNGAVLIAGDRRASGWNAFPQGVHETPDRWERPLKYSIIEHAERNALYSAARNGICTNGATLVAVWAACENCARAIIQCGVHELVRLPNNLENTSPQWRESIAIADTMLKEAGIWVTELDPDQFQDVEPLRRDGKPWLPS